LRHNHFELLIGFLNSILFHANRLLHQASKVVHHSRNQNPSNSFVVKPHFFNKQHTAHGSDDGQQSTSMGKEIQENTVAPCFGISFLDAEFLSLSYVVG
jgi:hypothetical protein